MNFQPKTPTPPENEWKIFSEDGLLWDGSKSNVRYNFLKMMEVFGQSYVFFLEVQYLMRHSNGMTLEETAKVNGDVPIRYFDRFLLNENFLDSDIDWSKANKVNTDVLIIQASAVNGVSVKDKVKNYLANTNKLDTAKTSATVTV